MTFKGTHTHTTHIYAYLNTFYEVLFLPNVLYWAFFPPLSSLSNSQPVTGVLALYNLALKSSCYDLNTVSFTVNERSEALLTHLKNQMELEKEHIACKVFVCLFDF